jgi:hypothetical protein
VAWWEDLSALRPVTVAPVLQLAADGAWEQAAVVSLPAGLAAGRAALDTAVAAARVDVALEILWPGQVFIGVRWPREAISAAKAALDRVLAVFSAAAASGEWTVTAALRAALDGQLGQELDLVEVGAVNAWRSIGPQMIWCSGQLGHLGQLDAALAVLHERSDLLGCGKPVAVEFVAYSPRPHWIGVYVSKEQDGQRRLDEAALGELLAAVLPISPDGP